MANLIRRQQEGRELSPQRGWDPFRMMGELLRWDPFRDFTSATPAAIGMGFVPSFDVRETKDAYQFTADLPGMREEDLDISVSGNTLTVSGRREAEERQDDEQYYYSERSYGEFRRSFALPDGADPQQVQADLRNGVLRISIHKRAEVQPRKITVGGGAQAQPAAKS